MITWITENVAIGDSTDAINEELLRKEKIDCILNLTTFDSRIVENTITSFLGVKYFHIYVGRHQGLEPIKIELRVAAYMLELLVKRYKRILIHCTAGMDRSPFVVAYWIVKYQGNDICENKEDLKFWISAVYKVIKEKRPQIIEHVEWV